MPENRDLGAICKAVIAESMDIDKIVKGESSDKEEIFGEMKEHLP